MSPFHHSFAVSCSSRSLFVCLYVCLFVGRSLFRQFGDLQFLVVLGVCF